MAFAMVVAGGIAAAGAITGAVISSSGAKSAANTQAQAALNSAELQAQTADQSLQFQGNLANTEIANQQPWYQSGEGALAQLDSLMGITPGAPAGGVTVPENPFGTNGQLQNTAQTGANNPAGTTVAPSTPGASAPFQASAPGTVATDANGNPAGGAASSAPLMQGWDKTFQAPTAAEAAATPGEQYMLQQAQQAGNMSAAASGNLLTGGTAKALENNAEGMASTNYQNAYTNALQNYQTNYNTFQTNQTNQYNRLANIAGMGQTSVAQLNNGLSATGGQVAGTMANAAGAINAQNNMAAAATASGYINSANAYGGAFSSMGNTASNYAMLNMLNNQGGSGSSFSNPVDAGGISNQAYATWGG
jgi:hypothetical protein